MGEKDITEKILAYHNDVFADIMNGFLFQGRQLVSPDDLVSTKDKSQYKADGRIHEQERDVSKYLKKNNITVLMAGFEHQTDAEKFMPIRQGGYDFAAYRGQLSDKDVNRVYPVITLVLYFGTTRWPYSHHVVDLIDTPEEYKPFVSDYEMKNLFEVAFLEPEQLKWFHSDFRYVADYFVQMRLNNDYKPNPDTIKHVNDTLKLMSVLTGDSRFEDAIPELSKKGDVSMCDVLDRVENKGREEGITQGRAEGITQGRTEGRTEGKIFVYYHDMELSAEQIAEKLNMPLEDVLKIIKSFK